MPWCPKCRNEYYEGVTVCPDCNVELVEDLDAYDEEQKLQRLREYREMMEDADEPDEELQEEDMESAKEEESEVLPGMHPVSTFYRDSADKAEDNRSSAVVLLVVGIVGIILSVLCALGIIPLFQSSANRIMTIGVMSFMFLVFIIMGVVSFKSAKKYSSIAKGEQELRVELKKWCDDNLKAEKLDEGLLEAEDEDDQLLYFQRTERMKKCIRDNFLNLDEGLLDHFVDEYYPVLFEGTKA
jgi:hypothetical protein